MTTHFIDELDADGHIIASHPETDLKSRMFMHKVSVILPKTKAGNYILARRAMTKKPYPDTWMCAIGGKTHTGESDIDAARREMQEEGSLVKELEYLGLYVHDDDTYKAYFSIFTTIQPVAVEDFVCDPREIAYLKAFSQEQLKLMINENPADFAPTFLGILHTLTKQ